MTYDPDFPELDMSPIDPTDSSWLKNDPPKEPPEESRPTEEWSDDRMERDEVVDVDAVDRERGAYPYSLKYGWSSASCAVIRRVGVKHNIFCKQSTSYYNFR